MNQKQRRAPSSVKHSPARSVSIPSPLVEQMLSLGIPKDQVFKSRPKVVDDRNVRPSSALSDRVEIADSLASRQHKQSRFPSRNENQSLDIVQTSQVYKLLKDSRLALSSNAMDSLTSSRNRPYSPEKYEEHHQGPKIAWSNDNLQKELEELSSASHQTIRTLESIHVGKEIRTEYDYKMLLESQPLEDSLSINDLQPSHSNSLTFKDLKPKRPNQISNKSNLNKSTHLNSSPPKSVQDSEALFYDDLELNSYTIINAHDAKIHPNDSTLNSNDLAVLLKSSSELFDISEQEQKYLEHYTNSAQKMSHLESKITGIEAQVRRF